MPMHANAPCYQANYVRSAGDGPAEPGLVLSSSLEGPADVEGENLVVYVDRQWCAASVNLYNKPSLRDPIILIQYYKI